MADLTPAALRLAGKQHGVISIKQLTRRNVGRSTIRRLERTKVLIRDHKSVRRLASAPRSLEQRCAALCLAHPKAFVSGPTAGTLLGLRKMPKRSPITLSSQHPLHVEHEGVRFRRSTKVAVSDTDRRSDGIRIARPVRLAFDLAAYLRDHDHRSVVDQLIHEHGVTIEALLKIGTRLCHPTRPGSHRFASTLLALSDAPTESDAELVVAEALWARDVPVATNLQWLDLPNGKRARLDLSVAEVRWGVEVDVHPSHLGMVGSTSAKRRDRQTELVGWRIHRVTGLDLLDLDGTADELAALYRYRRNEVAA